MVKRLILQQRLDSAAADPLRSEIAAAEGDDLAVDASGVAFLGGLCLELLMCSRQIWETGGHAFFIDQPSWAFVDDLSRFGLSPGALSAGGGE